MTVYLMKVNTYASLGGVVMNSPNLYKRLSMHLINLAQLNKLYYLRGSSVFILWSISLLVSHLVAECG